MRRLDLEKYKMDQQTTLAVFICGLTAAVILALSKSPYTGEAFALLGGVLGGRALVK
jgi:hypothetical protein